ncbi:MutS2 family protein [Dethiosulfatibacter aminovorans DSM 17477]|uniref:MutS2 family protein n=1 Tax=Dethiosulfatibacter aminovorans DSM 17477 TaxID=1121476 RepID=A0A1M6ITA4_9FIRM|nr:hypothetical protein [Dethiosulfatibacter aminovorans]SHJ37686.1 MutS2 family protein [Dethiosulfatibacter aminovorans DSM 17477]
MNKKIYEKLNYYEIKEELKNHALSELGKEKIERLEPLTSRKGIENSLEKTTEAVEILSQGRGVPMYGLSAVNAYIDKADKGVILKPTELVKIADFQRGCLSMKKFIQDFRYMAPVLSSFSENINECGSLEDEILACINGADLRHDASPRLGKLNKKKKTTEDRIKTKLETLISNSSYSKYLQESFVAERMGKYTLPVKRTYKSMVKGSIIDESSTGSTVFIEPDSVKKITLELEQINYEIQDEEYQILSTLTGFVSMYRKELEMNAEIMSEYDFAFAKGKYSLAINGKRPELSPGDEFVIRRGRHPLLVDPVPLDFNIGEDFRTLVITGPNTGGKTIVLKTVGLMTLMLQSGLHLPVGEGSIFPVFSEIFVDVGDAQDIKNSLSTFSGHMKNIVEITNGADSKSLVLLDEIGTGTDPREGAAIGSAVLEDLYKNGALTVVTTHYSKIKDFAEEMNGFQNAKMLFNAETLEPYYKLVIGDAGESNALWISERLGLKKSILKRSAELTGEKEVSSTQTIRARNIQPKTRKPEKEKVKKQKKFFKGDLVINLNDNEKAILFEGPDEKGMVNLSRNYEFFTLPVKRIKLIGKASDLYPADYDMDQLFYSFKVRKFDRDVSRGGIKSFKELKDRLEKINK